MVLHPRKNGALNHGTDSTDQIAFSILLHHRIPRTKMVERASGHRRTSSLVSIREGEKLIAIPSVEFRSDSGISCLCPFIQDLTEMEYRDYRNQEETHEALIPTLAPSSYPFCLMEEQTQSFDDNASESAKQREQSRCSSLIARLRASPFRMRPAPSRSDTSRTAATTLETSEPKAESMPSFGEEYNLTCLVCACAFV